MKTSKSYLQAIFFYISFLSFNSITQAQIDITYENDFFECTISTEENASFNCSFNGTLSAIVVGDPNQTFNIFAPVDVINGEFSFTYVLNAVAPTSIEVIWTIETSDDASGCALVGTSISTTVQLNCECSPVVQTFPINHESCYQCADGSTQLLVSGMHEPITYQWSNGAITSTIENLAPGTYNLTATGSNIDPCIAYGTVTINPYECATTQIEYGSSPIQCNGVCNAIIDIQGLANGNEITGVSWSDGSDQLFREALCTGTYSVTITTSDNCPYYAEFDIEEPLVLEVEAKEIIHANGTETGSIMVAANGGITPYSYFISQDGESIDHDSSESKISNLEPGCYDIKVIDHNGCVAELDSVCVDNLSSAHSIINSVFSIYPNPCGGYLKVETDSNYEVMDVKIYNILGEKQNIEITNNQILLDRLKNGIYIIDIVTDRGHWVKQFVKKQF